MFSKLDTTHDPHDVLEIAPDVVLVARAAAEFPSLAPDGVGQPFDRQPNMATAASPSSAPRVDTTFRASDVDEIARGRSSGGRWLKTASMAFALALVGAVATAAWERYGDRAQAMTASFAPRLSLPSLDLASWLPWQRVAAASQQDAPALPSVATDQSAAAGVPASGSAPAQTASPQTTAPQPAAAQDSAPALQSVSRDVAGLTQEVEALKASIAELKASQEQLSRDMVKSREAKAPEPKLSEAKPAELRPRIGAPPRSLGTIVQHKPKPPMYPQPVQATISPPPVQIAPAPIGAGSTSADDVVVRPPMPVR
jgi:hypothetical protein